MGHNDKKNCYASHKFSSGIHLHLRNISVLLRSMGRPGVVIAQTNFFASSSKKLYHFVSHKTGKLFGTFAKESMNRDSSPI